MEKQWYMVYTRKEDEKKVFAILKRKKIESYCPLTQTEVNYFRKKKLLTIPLFTSYIFAKLDEKSFTRVRKIRGVINIVYWKNEPAVIQDEEIEILKEFVRNYKKISLEKSPVEPGTIKYTNYPVYEMGSNSVLIRANVLKVRLPSIGFTLVAEVERSGELKVPNTFFITAEAAL